MEVGEKLKGKLFDDLSDKLINFIKQEKIHNIQILREISLENIFTNILKICQIIDISTLNVLIKSYLSSSAVKQMIEFTASLSKNYFYEINRKNINECLNDIICEKDLIKTHKKAIFFIDLSILSEEDVFYVMNFVSDLEKGYINCLVCCSIFFFFYFLGFDLSEFISKKTMEAFLARAKSSEELKFLNNFHLFQVLNEQLSSKVKFIINSSLDWEMMKNPLLKQSPFSGKKMQFYFKNFLKINISDSSFQNSSTLLGNFKTIDKMKYFKSSELIERSFLIELELIKIHSKIFETPNFDRYLSNVLFFKRKFFEFFQTKINSIKNLPVFSKIYKLKELKIEKVKKDLGKLFIEVEKSEILIHEKTENIKKITLNLNELEMATEILKTKNINLTEEHLNKKEALHQFEQNMFTNPEELLTEIIQILKFKKNENELEESEDLKVCLLDIINLSKNIFNENSDMIQNLTNHGVVFLETLKFIRILKFDLEVLKNGKKEAKRKNMKGLVGFFEELENKRGFEIEIDDINYLIIKNNDELDALLTEKHEFEEKLYDFKKKIENEEDSLANKRKNISKKQALEENIEKLFEFLSQILDFFVEKTLGYSSFLPNIEKISEFLAISMVQIAKLSANVKYKILNI